MDRVNSNQQSYSIGNQISNDAIDEAISIAELIDLTRDALHKARQKEMNKINLNARWGAILWAIHSLGDDATLVKIAQLTARRRHTMSHMLSKLEQAGMVRRIRDLDRKNRVRAVLTAKGADLFEQLSDRQSVKRIMSVVPSLDQKQLIEYLETIIKKARVFLGQKAINIAPFPDQQDFHLYRLLINTAEAISEAKEKELKQNDLGIRRNAVLNTIEAIGSNASPAQIARHLQRKCNTITSILAKMKQDELIKFVKDTKSEKRFVIKLTQKGYEKYLASRKGNVIPQLLSALSKEKRKRLKLYLQIIHSRGLEEIGES